MGFLNLKYCGILLIICPLKLYSVKLIFLFMNSDNSILNFSGKKIVLLFPPIFIFNNKYLSDCFIFLKYISKIVSSFSLVFVIIVFSLVSSIFGLDVLVSY